MLQVAVPIVIAVSADRRGLGLGERNVNFVLLFALEKQIRCSQSNQAG
jgi:hypothetical protein